MHKRYRTNVPSQDVPMTTAKEREAHNADDAQERLGRAKRAIELGKNAAAIDELLRLVEHIACDHAFACECALLLATSYGQLGHFLDASEWLTAAQRHIECGGGHDGQRHYDACHAALLHLSGDEVNAIRAANAALLRHSKRVTDTYRRNLLQTLAAAYLRLGQIARARQCALAALEGPIGKADRASGLMLLGDINLWTIVRQHPRFRGQVLVADDFAQDALQHEALIAAALKSYGEADEASDPGSLLKRQALAGMAQARLAARSQSADWNALENHVNWAAQEGLLYQRDLMRLHLGVLLLLHQRAREARRWLIPLADRVMRTPRAPFEHDALFFASVACGSSGSHQSALEYLSRYNAAIRDQHLSRITVPPPNLDSAGRSANGTSLSRRRGDSDQEMVDHVLERLRNAPSAPLDSERMAQLAGVSRRTLENGFRRITGMPPKEFTTRLRLAEFRRRKLAAAPSGAAELELLAKSVGFSSYRALARCERRIAASEDGLAAEGKLPEEGPPQLNS